MQCFHREDCKRALHKFPEGFFTSKQTDKIILKEQTPPLEENRFSLLEIWKKKQTTNKAVHIGGSLF